jgi:hypothetical protein
VAVARLPPSVQARALAAARPSNPFLGPQPPTVGGPDSLVRAGPLYAGEGVRRITELMPAAEIVRLLTP